MSAKTPPSGSITIALIKGDSKTVLRADFAMIAACIAVTTAITISWQWRRVRATTLSAPFVWAILASVFFAATEAFLTVRGDHLPIGAWSLLRYAAACATLCPGMAVLGAKRPQDRGWQWIVGSLWCVLLLPVGQTIAAGGAWLQLSGLWIVFCAALILVTGPLNYAASCNWAAAWLLAAAQSLFFWSAVHGEHGVRREAVDPLAIFGAGLGLSAVIVALAVWRRPRPKRGLQDMADWQILLSDLDDRWYWFRNAFGAFWELRASLRMNQTAQVADWPVRLSHGGFVGVQAAGDSVDVQLDCDLVPQIEQAFDTVLRRFERVDRSGLVSSESR